MAALPFPELQWVSTALAILVAFGVYRLSQVGRRDPRFPPGPPTIPVLGNLHQIPITGLYKKVKEWSDKYGPVYTLKLGPATMIVLSDRKSVHDLLDKKSAIYSGRPDDYIATLVTHMENFAHMDNKPMWRAQRKVAAQSLTPRFLDDKVAPLQEAENAILLQDLLETPDRFFTHVRRTANSLANIVVWGHRGDTYGNFWGCNAYSALKGYSEALQFGANPPVDQFTFLQRIPDFMAPWKRRAKLAYNAMHDAWTEARRRADKRRDAGDKRASMYDRIMDDEIKFDVPQTENQLNHFLGTMVEGGAETTASSILTSLLQLSIHPEVQKRAQKELDEVCGSERMPVWSDFPNLPYINCIVKEAVRWKPVAPLGVPHCAKQDDWYNGMLIPKAATVLMPIWAIHMIEKNGYEDPDVYNPSRWEKHTRLGSELAGISDYPNRDHYSYGAGRRVCVGMHLAERNMWRMTAKLLWAFDLVPDHHIDPENYNEGIHLSPKPYKIEFRPRSEAHVRTIIREAVPAQEFLFKYE